MIKEIKKILNDSARLKSLVAQRLSLRIEQCALIIIECYKKGGKLILFGNGGSAADAQHISTELVHQFKYKKRKALPALALNTNSSLITAISNDWGYDKIFERQVEALVNQKDVIIGISTSGNSQNVINGLKQAKLLGAKTISLLGKDGGIQKGEADLDIIIPSEDTARIQEIHITILHIICELVEKKLFNKK